MGIFGVLWKKRGWCDMEIKEAWELIKGLCEDRMDSYSHCYPDGCEEDKALEIIEKLVLEGDE